MYYKIDDLAQLRRNVEAKGMVQGFVALNGGLRSSKDIQLVGDTWNVYNHIDDSEVDFATDAELLASFPVGEALKLGALYSYDPLIP